MRVRLRLHGVPADAWGNLARMDNWSKLVVFFLWVSVLLGKASAYLGMTIGILMLLDSRVLLNRWYLALTRNGDPLSGVAWAMLVSLIYGIAQVVRGCLFLGFPVTTALEILVFNLCPVIMFLGLWAGARHPGIVRSYIRFVTLFLVVYTPLYVLFFHKLTISLSGILPGTNMDLLGSPGTGSWALLGLLSYESRLGQWWLPIVVLICLMVANEERADWLGFAVALGVWGFLRKRMGRVMAIVCAVATILAVGFLTDLRLPPIPGRGGEISARATVARLAGSISTDMAEDMGGDAADARFYYGTVYWRKHWWAGIRDEVSRNSENLVFGLGYGFPLDKLGGPTTTDVRSPHDIFYFALAYSGALGVAIFFWLEISIIRLLWRSYKLTGDVYGLSYFCYAILGAFFGNRLETPQGGIAVYLLLGLVLGPVCVVYRAEERRTVPEWSSHQQEIMTSSQLT